MEFFNRYSWKGTYARVLIYKLILEALNSTVICSKKKKKNLSAHHLI